MINNCKKEVIPAGFKRCSKCGTIKHLGDFTKQAAKPDGHSYLCRECKRASSRASRLRYPDRERARKKRYRETHVEQIREYFRQYRAVVRERYAADPSKRKRWNCEAYQRHRDKILAATKLWQQNNPEKVRAIKLRQRARLAGVGGTYDALEWIAKCVQWGCRCLCCGSPDDLTIDHIIPISRGGMNIIDNLQLLCRSCNSKKHTNIIDYRPQSKSLKNEIIFLVFLFNLKHDLIFVQE